MGFVELLALLGNIANVLTTLLDVRTNVLRRRPTRAEQAEIIKAIEAAAQRIVDSQRYYGEAMLSGIGVLAKLAGSMAKAAESLDKAGKIISELADLLERRDGADVTAIRIHLSQFQEVRRQLSSGGL